MLSIPIIALTLLAQAPLPSPKAKPTPSPQTLAARSLVEAELAFAKQAAEENTRAAFLGVLDRMGVLFRPGPVNGVAWLGAQKADASTLSWFPAFVEVSQAGDLGYSTGPYQWRAEAGSDKVFYGHFVSIWARRGGVWKLLLDTGTSHAAPGEEDPVFQPENPKGVLQLEAAPFSAEALQGLERDFANASSTKNLLSAYTTYLAPNARLYREGAFPTTDLNEIRRALEKKQGAVAWTCLGGEVAKSSDLGYTYGISECKPAQKATLKPHAQSAMFLHVWKRQPSGRWKVILDIENPMPETKP